MNVGLFTRALHTIVKNTGSRMAGEKKFRSVSRGSQCGYRKESVHFTDRVCEFIRPTQYSQFSKKLAKYKCGCVNVAWLLYLQEIKIQSYSIPSLEVEFCVRIYFLWRNGDILQWNIRANKQNSAAVNLALLWYSNQKNMVTFIFQNTILCGGLFLVAEWRYNAVRYAR